MSEYWKSTPKYYCKYCKMFVVDTPVSKKNHDASMKHQGTLKRFLRDLHRANEKELHASAAAKREVARLNALVGGPSTTTTTSSSSPSTPTYKPHPPRATNGEERKRQLKELEALGVALPDDARRELAMLGDWTETVEAPKIELTEREKAQIETMKQQKRKFEDEEKERKWNAMDEDERAMRGFKIQTRTYPKVGVLEGAFRPMAFKGKSKSKAGDPSEEVEVRKEEDAPGVGTEELPGVKGDPEPVSIKTEETNIKKEEPENIGDGIVFKKRKVKNIRKRV